MISSRTSPNRRFARVLLGLLLALSSACATATARPRKPVTRERPAVASTSARTPVAARASVPIPVPDLPSSCRAISSSRVAVTGDGVLAVFSRALSAEQAGDWALAAHLWGALVPRAGVLADRVLMHAARSALKLGKKDRAESLFERVPSSSRVYAEARFGLATLREGRGDLSGALDALQPLSTRAPVPGEEDVGAKALLKMADLAEGLNEVETERALLLELWAAHPLAEESDLAAARLGSATPPTSSAIERGIALISAHHNLAGVRLLRPAVAKLSKRSPLTCRALYALGKGLRSARRHTEAEATLRKVVKRCADPELKVKALYVLGASQSVVDQKAGVRTYRELAKRFPDHSYADDALFYAADLEQKLGRKKAARLLLKRLARRHPDGDYAAEALFRSFWLAKAAGRKRRGLHLLELSERRLARTGRSTRLARERYWRAKVYEQLGRKKSAGRLMAALARGAPTTYYGWLAEGGLEGTSRRAPSSVPKSTASSPDAKIEHAAPVCAEPSIAHRHLAEGVALLRLGLSDEAADELAAVSSKGLSRGERTTWAFALAAAGDLENAHEVAGELLGKALGGPILEKDRPLWEVAYPAAFHDLVVKDAEAARVPPALLQALIREESGLDPSVRSWAGAVGLSQLMLSTAQHVAKRLGVKDVTPERLKDPKLNLKLGAAYLGKLLHRFDGKLPYAVAAYNAGGTAVRRWRRANPGPADAWVENIPIEQTRRYVKRVLRSFQIYRLLYPKLYGTDRVTAAERTSRSSHRVGPAESP